MSAGETEVSVAPPSIWQRLFKEQNVPLTAFPDRFLMEAMTGVFGSFFTIIWFWVLAKQGPSFFPDLAPIGLVILLIYFVAMGFSIVAAMDVPFTDFASKFRNPSMLSAEEARTLAIRARVMIALFSAVYAIACGALIWLSGGARSPFVPFYVMTFALTVTYTKVPAWFWIVLIYFLTVVAIACFAAAHFPPPVDPRAWTLFMESEVQTGFHFAFVCLSLIVPTISSAAVADQIRKRERASKAP